MIDTHELAWAAGFFDGEGHIACTRGKRKSDPQRFVYRTIILDIRQIDRRVLDRFKAAIGGVGYIYGPWKKNNPNAHDYFAYSLTRSLQVQKAIQDLWPWLSPVKREQATKAIEAWKSELRLAPGRKSSSGIKGVYWDKRQKRWLVRGDGASSRRKYIGRFITKEAAINARLQIKKGTVYP